jgi:hypothetical protein
LTGAMGRRPPAFAAGLVLAAFAAGREPAAFVPEAFAAAPAFVPAAFVPADFASAGFVSASSAAFAAADRAAAVFEEAAFAAVDFAVPAALVVRPPAALAGPAAFASAPAAAASAPAAFDAPVDFAPVALVPAARAAGVDSSLSRFGLPPTVAFVADGRRDPPPCGVLMLMGLVRRGGPGVSGRHPPAGINSRPGRYQVWESTPDNIGQ